MPSNTISIISDEDGDPSDLSEENILLRDRFMKIESRDTKIKDILSK